MARSARHRGGHPPTWSRSARIRATILARSPTPRSSSGRAAVPRSSRRRRCVRDPPQERVGIEEEPHPLSDDVVGEWSVGPANDEPALALPGVGRALGRGWHQLCDRTPGVRDHYLLAEQDPLRSTARSASRRRAFDVQGSIQQSGPTTGLMSRRGPCLVDPSTSRRATTESMRYHQQKPKRRAMSRRRERSRWRSCLDPVSGWEAEP